MFPILDALANHQLRSMYVGMALAAELTQEKCGAIQSVKYKTILRPKKGEIMQARTSAAIATIVLLLMPLMVLANERPGPRGSVGGGSGSAGKGVPQMQTPVDPMQQQSQQKSPSESGGGKGTQNSKSENDKKDNTDKAK
jgi:hypothetical protein